MADFLHLEKRLQTWYAVRDVPRKLRTAMGRKRLVASLKTRDINVARARRWAALAIFQKTIDAATKRVTVSPEIEVGMAYREHLASIDRGEASGSGYAAVIDGEDIEVDPHGHARELTESALGDALSDLERQWGYARAKVAADIAFGRATPLLTYVDAWLDEGGARGPVKPRTARQYRRDMAALEAWLRSAAVAPTVEAVSKKAAGRYITEALAKEGSRKTANRKISAVSAYWRWLVKRGIADGNPWSGQSLSKLSTPDTAPRPFTDAELAALFAGAADSELRDAMVLGALSGMRIEELYRLSAADCVDGWFQIRQAKSRAGVRRVPIHPELAAVVNRRLDGVAPSAFLMHEQGPLRAGRERSAVPSKRFGLYRQRVGVHDRTGGQRQSRVNFHSFRRWFVTTARNAGFDRAVVAAVVGHEVGNLTDDTYSGGPSDALRVACVAAVRLPDGARDVATTPSPKRARSARRSGVSHVATLIDPPQRTTCRLPEGLRPKPRRVLASP